MTNGDYYPWHSANPIYYPNYPNGFTYIAPTPPQPGWLCPECLTVWAPIISCCMCKKASQATITVSNTGGDE